MLQRSLCWVGDSRGEVPDLLRSPLLRLMERLRLSDFGREELFWGFSLLHHRSVVNDGTWLQSSLARDRWTLPCSPVHRSRDPKFYCFLINVIRRHLLRPSLRRRLGLRLPYLLVYDLSDQLVRFWVDVLIVKKLSKLVRPVQMVTGGCRPWPDRLSM